MFFSSERMFEGVEKNQEQSWKLASVIEGPVQGAREACEEASVLAPRSPQQSQSVCASQTQVSTVEVSTELVRNGVLLESLDVGKWNSVHEWSRVSVISVRQRTCIKCGCVPGGDYKIRGCFKIEGQFPRTWIRKEEMSSDSIWAAQRNKVVPGCGLPFVYYILVPLCTTWASSYIPESSTYVQVLDMNSQVSSQS